MLPQFIQLELLLQVLLEQPLLLQLEFPQLRLVLLLLGVLLLFSLVQLFSLEQLFLVLGLVFLLLPFSLELV